MYLLIVDSKRQTFPTLQLPPLSILKLVVPWYVGMTSGERGRDAAYGNDQTREGITCSCIIGIERKSERNLLIYQSVKEMVGDLYYQTCKIVM